MKSFRVVLLAIWFVFLLTGCQDRQEPIQPTPTPSVQETTPASMPSAPLQTDIPLPTKAPSLSISTAAPTPPFAETTPVSANPDEIRQQEGVAATVEDFYHRPYEELPQDLRDSLKWDGQVQTEPGYNFRLRRYTGPGIVVTTTEVADEAFQDWLDWQLGLPVDDEAREGTDEELRAEYEREKDREWLYSVTITDDSYTTALGLKVGSTVDEAEALGYPLRQRLNDEGDATFGDTWDHSLRVHVKDDVVEELYLTWGIGRYTGKYWDL